MIQVQSGKGKRGPQSGRAAEQGKLGRRARPPIQCGRLPAKAIRMALIALALGPKGVAPSSRGAGSGDVAIQAPRGAAVLKECAVVP